MQDKLTNANGLTQNSRLLNFFFNGHNYKLFYYCITILFVYLADSIMSYVTPSYLEDGLNSTTLMGIIFATSSAVGFIVDFLFGEMFANKNYRFFLKWSIVLAIGFPFGYLILPASIITFLIGLAIWGIYFELISFSNSRYVIEKTDPHHHELAWGIMYFFRASSLTFGPLLAAVLLNISYNAAFSAAIFFLIIAIILYYLEKDKHRAVYKSPEKFNVNVLKEAKLWSLFSKKLWLLLLFGFGTVFIDASFWSIGTILSEDLYLQNGGIPGVLLVLYSLPLFFMGFFAKRFAVPLGKKRAAFITAAIGSVFLILSGLTKDYNLICLFTFIFACFFAVSGTELKGVFADYDARTGKFSNSLIGLESGVYSLAYIISPIVSGILADKFGINTTFSIIGIGMLFIIIICLLLTPKKIKMPQSDLELLEG